MLQVITPSKKQSLHVPPWVDRPTPSHATGWGNSIKCLSQGTATRFLQKNMAYIFMTVFAKIKFSWSENNKTSSVEKKSALKANFCWNPCRAKIGVCNVLVFLNDHATKNKRHAMQQTKRLCLGNHSFVKVPPRNCKGNFSVFESSCHLLLPV